MMSNESMRTPRREALFEGSCTPVSQRQAPPSMSRMTFTPCTRLAQMTLASQSNARTRLVAYEPSRTNFNQKLLEAVREDDQDHPNLTMVLGQDKIRFDPYTAMDNRLGGSSLSFPSDDDSDALDSLASLSPGRFSSPDRVYSRKNIFDNSESLTEQNETPSLSSTNAPRRARKSIFDDEDNDNCRPMILTDDDLLVGDDASTDRYYDPSVDWIHHIYEDKDDAVSDDENDEGQANKITNEVDQENRQPRSWTGRQDETESAKKIRRFLPHEENNEANTRAPLQEIRLDDYQMTDDDKHTELPAKKKIVLDRRGPSSSTTPIIKSKMRFMRSLSPTRDARRKGKQAMASPPMH